MAGRVELARAIAEEAVKRARQLGNVNLLAAAYNGTAWALQRCDPPAALAAAEQYLDLYGELDIDVGPGSVMALAGGLRARLGDDIGGLELLHEAVRVSRDQGAPDDGRPRGELPGTGRQIDRRRDPGNV
jgi:hypothetical protein